VNVGGYSKRVELEREGEEFSWETIEGREGGIFLVGGDSFVAPMFLIECRGSFLMPDARDLGSFNPV